MYENALKPTHKTYKLRVTGYTFSVQHIVTDRAKLFDNFKLQKIL